jgi:hypothetical protein
MRAAAVLMAVLLLGAAGEAPQDFITHYCGGGVTGGGGGLVVTSDGTVMRLRRARAGAPANEAVIRQGEAAAYARIGALLDAARFERVPRGEPSNMTCSITRRRGGQSHVVMWGISRAPPALAEALRALEALGRAD